MKLRSIAAMLCLSSASVACFAQKLTPGLWEHQVSMKSSSGEMEALMAQTQAEMVKLPPEQRKMMEEMMAKHGVGLGSKPNSSRICLTAEQVARDEWPQDPGRNCKNQISSRSGNTVRYRFTCEGPPPTTGEGEITVTSDKAYKGNAIITSTPQGKAENVEMQVAATWVSSDCGALKKP